MTILSGTAARAQERGFMAQQPLLRAFEDEALTHMPSIARYAGFVVPDAEDARDLVQETFLEAWRCFDRYQPGTNCKAWLFRIFRNLLSKKRRKEARQGPTVELDALENPDAVLPVGESFAEPADQLESEEIQRALRALPGEYRDVLLLLLEDLSYREIADTLGIPAGTVMSRIHRGREALRHMLHMQRSSPSGADSAG